MQKKFVIFITIAFAIFVNNIFCADIAHTVDLEIMEFLEAIENCKIQQINSFLAKGINVNACEYFGTTALILATRNGDEQIVKMLLEYKQDDDSKRVNVNASDYFGMTPLIHAVFGGNPTIVRMLLDYRHDDPTSKVNINAVDKMGFTAFKHAIDLKKENIVQIFKDYQKDKPEFALVLMQMTTSPKR